MIAYERFIADIYDHSPFFGQGKTRELDKFNAPYFRHLAGRPGPLLEFGTGTGNLSIPLARAGYRFDSVDISPYMQAVARLKLSNEDERVVRNVNLIVADATTYESPEPCNSIVMPEGILIAIADAEVQMALLRSCHRNLKARGRIFTDFFQPYYKAIDQGTLTEHTRFRTPDGKLYLMTMEITTDRYTQVQQWKATYTLVENGEQREPVEVILQFRYVFCSEVRWMLQAAGFCAIDIDVDFADARGFFVVAEKA